MLPISIFSDSGELVQAQAPVIISASRSTDIPAFYAEWFFNRLRAGYVAWYNPFNRRKVYVSFKNTRVVVFWTKNPQPIIPYLKELDSKGIRYYFQFTLNDYEREGFEPNVPPLAQRIETLKTLVECIGKERIIWRFDPLIITPHLSLRELLMRIWRVGNQIRRCIDKLVFSFIDIKAYRKVQNNLQKEVSDFLADAIENYEFTSAQMNEFAKGLAELRERWRTEGWPIALATCAEQVDLDSYGIDSIAMVLSTIAVLTES